jgi:hypothetical protein
MSNHDILKALLALALLALCYGLLVAILAGLLALLGRE